MPPTLDIHFGDNLTILKQFPAESFDLIYIDPPFNTGKVQKRTRIQTVEDQHGDRVGFQGKRSLRTGREAWSAPRRKHRRRKVRLRRL